MSGPVYDATMDGDFMPLARPGSPELDVRRLGSLPYLEALRLQEGLLKRRVEGTIGDTLVLCEHEGVITTGRGVQADLSIESGESGVPIIAVSRGGEATWHGPGQVVGYPIFELSEGRRDLHRHMRDLEEVLIRVLAELDIQGVRVEGLTGVWVGEKKVASIGVACRRWVTWHGFALNVFNRPVELPGFRPCGLEPSSMACLADFVELPKATILVEVLIVKQMLEVFGLALPERPMPPQPPEDPRGFPTLPLLP